MHNLKLVSWLLQKFDFTSSLQEEAVRAQEAVSVPVFNNEYGHGVPEQQPENSVYYHPTLNPSGVPPPGKPQRYRTDPTNGPRVPLPVPAAPPLPAGPAPGERCMSD